MGVCGTKRVLPSRWDLLRAPALLSMLLVSGCISRILEIRTDPPGAWVYLDGQELGKTPLRRPFSDYGPRRLVVARQGCKPISETVKLSGPWWCSFPFDFFAELYPGTLEDRQRFSFTLERSEEAQVELEKLMRHLNDLRARLGSEKSPGGS